MNNFDVNTSEISIEKKLIKIFESVGVYIDYASYDEVLEIDSLQFVSVIMDIEETFLIRLTNDFEDFEMLETFQDFYKLVNIYFV